MASKKCKCGTILGLQGHERLFYICDNCGAVSLKYSNLENRYAYIGNVTKEHILSTINDLRESASSGKLRGCKCKNSMIIVDSSNMSHPKAFGRPTVRYARYLTDFKDYRYWICISCGSVYEYRISKKIGGWKTYKEVK